MVGAASWRHDGRDWPHRTFSIFPFAAGMRWHVQRMGRGPSLLLLHGAGSSSHSWRGMLPRLAPGFDCIAPDLPGHAFSARPTTDGLSLPGMAKRVADLMTHLGVRPTIIVGHSAGAAIALRMVIDGLSDPDGVIAINGALTPMVGLAGSLFSPLARIFATTSLVPWLVSLRAEDRGLVERLLRGTGSNIDVEGVDLYARLFRRRGHVAATFGMMAQWDVKGLSEDLHRAKVPFASLIAQNDRTILPAEQARVRHRLPLTQFVSISNLGHLAHEEEPSQIMNSLEKIEFFSSKFCKNFNNFCDFAG